MIRLSRRSMQTASAALVKQLRQQSGAPILECKRALEASELDMDAAVEWLRKHGVAVAAKLASKEAAQGSVGVCVSDDHRHGVLLQLRCQTDFVAEGKSFQELLAKLTKDALGTAEAEVRSHAEEPIQEVVTRVRENIEVGRIASLRVSQGVIGSYIHNAATASSGQTGVLVGVTAQTDANDALLKLGKRIGMHITCSPPRYLCRDDVPAQVMDHERSIVMEQLGDSLKGKPEHIASKIVTGKLDKFYKEHCLLEQEYALSGMEGDGKKMDVSTLLRNESSNLGAPVTITGFVHCRAQDGFTH